MFLNLILAVSLPFTEEDKPSPEIVQAIIQHESRGNPRICRDEKDGSSSWGLMQLNHKGTSCAEGKHTRDFEPARNIRIGMYILALQHKWCREHCKGHDSLTHYAGKGKQAVRFAREIREMVRVGMGS